MKPCRKCGETDRVPGNGRCRPCRNKYIRERYRVNPAPVKANNRSWAERNPARVREIARRGQMRARLKRYGLTAESYEQLRAAGCAICQAHPRMLHFDHDHVTGAFRGLLCSQCNPGLGMFKDQPARLREAARYLEERK